MAFGSGAAPGPGSSGSGSGSRSATGSAEPTEAGSWAGSSPSSISTTTRTNSVTVTSPDSTGSDSGAGYVQQHAYPGSTGSYGTQTAEAKMTTATDSAALGSCTFFLFPLVIFKPSVHSFLRDHLRDHNLPGALSLETLSFLCQC